MSNAIPPKSTVPLIDQAHHGEIAEIMFEYRRKISALIEASLLPGARPLPTIGDPIPTSVIKKIVFQLRSSEVVLWRSDLLRHAEASGPDIAKVKVTKDHLPRVPELWCPYGRLGSLNYMPEENLLEMAQLYVTAPRKDVETGKHDGYGLLRVRFFAPTDAAGSVLPSALPHMMVNVPVSTGEYPLDEDAQSVMACLSFKASKIVTDDLVHPPRAFQRRMKRATGVATLVRVVQLRQKERAEHEQPHLSDREYQCQWRVRAHLRVLNAGTPQERVTWVSSYVKGPTDKPLKPPTQKVAVVVR